MTNRALLGGAAIVIVAAAVFWYVLWAPSQGSGVAPDQSVRVAISASAASTGTWVRYQITVKDLADGDFNGDVLLVDQDLASGAAGGASIGSLARNPSQPLVPAVAGQSAYRLHVTTASRTSRTVSVLAPSFFTSVEAWMGGRLLDAQAVEQPAQMSVAVVSDVERAANTIGGIHFDQLGVQPFTYGSARELPTNATTLAGYSAIVIDEFDTATLSAAQIGALRDFTGFGGTLILAGGSSWRRTLAPLAADLLPVRPATTGMVSLSPVGALAGSAETERTVMAAIGNFAQGARRVLDDPQGTPLIAELNYGSGKVVQLTFDPSGDGTADTPYSALAWGQALARSLDKPPTAGPLATTMLGPDPSMTAFLPPADDAPLPPAWLLAGVLVLYLALAGPLAYMLVARRLRRPALFWAAVPAVALIFTGTFYAVGSSLQGSLQDHEIQVLRVGPGQSANLLEYHRVLFLRRGDHVITMPSGSLAAPLSLETFKTTGSTCERCTSQLGGLPSGAEHALPGPQPVIEETGVVYGSVRVVAASSVGRAPAGLDAHLTIKGGRIQGTLANPSGVPVWQLEAFSSDGQVVHRADLAGGLPPGGQVSVDSPLVAAVNSAQGSSGDAILLRAVAQSGLRARGDVVVVGLTLPVLSQLRVDGEVPPQAALAILEQTVPVAAGDSSLPDLERVWLTASTGDQRTGFVDTYDVLVPSATGSLELTYNSQWSPNIEVYDWSSASFLPVAGAGGSDPTRLTAPLTSAQVRDGLVRVRAHEPRLSWAANLSVGSPGT
jgi:hypothetical protein